MDKKIHIEVAYALPSKQQIIPLTVSAGTTVYEGAKKSGIDEIFPEIDFDQVDMGIFGKVVKKPKEEVLREGDRIEIYRPLIIDPKQARLNRAKKS
ncbi:MAG: RnfH family protein [Oleiphilaceae bacterium]|nr:RnfH family protein [Oleiphilaceae bacterium]